MSKTVHLLDYVAGNVRSLVNAIELLGYSVEWVRKPEDIADAQKLILPGVGHFGFCAGRLAEAGYLEAVKAHIAAGKPFMGICVGLQVLFEGSAENPAVPGIGLIPGTFARFDSASKAVPHIGWNGAVSGSESLARIVDPASRYYFVHSFALPYEPGRLERDGWNVTLTRYGDETFVSSIARGSIFATQFHPEKSGPAGLRVIKSFLEADFTAPAVAEAPRASTSPIADTLSRRIIACLDIRSNDAGELVVTKGDQYDVREKSSGSVRNLGCPVQMAEQYYRSGADEVVFLNITSFRQCPAADLPMLEMVRNAARTVFVPLTVGGGIKDSVDPDGKTVTAFDIAALYFAAGADKVSIGSDAVKMAERYWADRAAGKGPDGTTAIERISAAYGAQAVVVSVDPRRVWLASELNAPAGVTVTKSASRGPGGEDLCYFECTVKGGREGSSVDVVALGRAVEALGAGEILLNSIDKDGSNAGFDIELVKLVKETVRIPVIASSGAGCPAHFADVFEKAGADAALGAGIFHRNEYTVQQVKDYLAEHGFAVRKSEGV